MTEDEYWEAWREAEAYYAEEEHKAVFYEWLSAFEFCQRALSRMQTDDMAVKCGAVEMFRAFLQKEWEQRPLRFALEKATYENE